MSTLQYVVPDRIKGSVTKRNILAGRTERRSHMHDVTESVAGPAQSLAIRQEFTLPFVLRVMWIFTQDSHLLGRGSARMTTSRQRVVGQSTRPLSLCFRQSTTPSMSWVDPSL